MKLIICLTKTCIVERTKKINDARSFECLSFHLKMWLWVWDLQKKTKSLQIFMILPDCGFSNDYSKILITLIDSFKNKNVPILTGLCTMNLRQNNALC